jgi:hypothetical protein
LLTTIATRGRRAPTEQAPDHRREPVVADALTVRQFLEPPAAPVRLPLQLLGMLFEQTQRRGRTHGVGDDHAAAGLLDELALPGQVRHDRHQPGGQVLVQLAGGGVDKGGSGVEQAEANPGAGADAPRVARRQPAVPAHPSVQIGVGQPVEEPRPVR